MTTHAAAGQPPIDKLAIQYMAEIFETIDQGITVHDPAHRLILWNKQYVALELTPAKYIYRGAPLTETWLQAARQGVFGPGEPSEIAQERLASLTAGKLKTTELISAPSGAIVRVRQFGLEGGGFATTYSDVTEELQTQQQQRQAAKLDAIGQLTSGIAHDLNNLLNVILGNLDMATQSDAKKNPYLTKAIGTVERGSEFVQRLLAFARQHPLEPKLTDIGKLLADFLPLFPPVLGKEIAIRLVKAPGPLLSKIDANQLESVVMNLVINAKDAIADKGEISIRIDKATIGVRQARELAIAPGQYIQIQVSDDGCGMPAETVQKALQPFFTTKPAGAGTGLGLSGAHSFCQQCGGAIAIESQVGLGTTVALYVPVATSETTEPL